MLAILASCTNNARYYDPNTARFISADTVVPGNASGGMDGIAVKPLTVSFSEPGFLSKANQENQFGPWFTLSSEQKQQLGSPMGPANPQALNRYAYVMGNPLKYTDPSGHDAECGGKRQFRCGEVHNRSSHPVLVTGERACSSSVVGCTDGYELVTVILWPGESSTDYGIKDVDSITPLNSQHPIDGHGLNETYRLNGGDAYIYDDGNGEATIHNPYLFSFQSRWRVIMNPDGTINHDIPKPLNAPSRGNSPSAIR